MSLAPGPGTARARTAEHREVPPGDAVIPRRRKRGPKRTRDPASAAGSAGPWTSVLPGGTCRSERSSSAQRFLCRCRVQRSSERARSHGGQRHPEQGDEFGGLARGAYPGAWPQARHTEQWERTESPGPDRHDTASDQCPGKGRSTERIVCHRMACRSQAECRYRSYTLHKNFLKSDCRRQYRAHTMNLPRNKKEKA